MDGLASVSPGLGASFFGASVVLTMMAAHSFDPRLIWDRAGKGPLRAGRRSRPPAGIEVAS
jgi:paraquat-inducible protein A